LGLTNVSRHRRSDIHSYFSSSLGTSKISGGTSARTRARQISNVDDRVWLESRREASELMPCNVSSQPLPRFAYHYPVFSYVFSVAPEDLDTWDHPEVGLEVDGIKIGSHLTYDTVLRFCGWAWVKFFDSLGEGLFVPHVAMPRIECDYFAEVRPGEIQCRIDVVHIGRTSVKLQVEVIQDQKTTARTLATLVAFDHVEGRPTPLSEEQRNALSLHLVSIAM
jgi:acyl-CoA thioesterase FadM